MNNRQRKHVRKFPVPLVMRRNRHNGAGSVRNQNIIGNPDRNIFFCQRVDRIRAGKDAGFLLCKFSPLKVGFFCCFVNVLLHGGFLLPADNAHHERVLWSKHEVGCPENSVRAGGIHGNLFVVVRSGKEKVDFCSGTFANPISLHHFNGLRPVKFFQVFKEPLRIGGDLEHPLPDVLADNLCAAPLATTFFHFLIGKTGQAAWTPVNRRFRFVG